MSPTESNENPQPGLTRRSVVKGATWSIPVVAATVAVPMAAASTTVGPAVVFTMLPPAKPAGEPFDDVVITATVDGDPAPGGSSVTVTLPEGLTFADGTTSKVFSVGANGQVTVTGVRSTFDTVPGAYGISATYSTASATDAISVLKHSNIYAWGYNAEGQVGRDFTGHNENSRTALPWFGGREYSSVTAAWASLGAVAGSQVFTTGNSTGGVLATGTFGSSARVPVGPAVTADARGTADNDGVFSIADVASANNGGFDTTIFVRGTDGGWYGAGENAGGQFSKADGTTAGSADNGSAYTGFTPIGTEILAANSGAKILSVQSAGWYRAAYLLDDGTVWSSGRNYARAMGNNGVSDRQYLAAQAVKADGSALTGIVKVGVSQDTTVYLDGDGNLWGSGSNSWGQLPGISGTSAFAAPLTQPEGKKVADIWSSKADADTLLVRAVDNTCYVTGANNGGQGSTGSTAGSANTWTKVVGIPDGRTLKHVAFGNDGALYLLDNGDIYFAGNNDTGGAGDGTSGGYKSTMQKVSLPKPAVSIAASWWDTYAAVLQP